MSRFTDKIKSIFKDITRLDASPKAIAVSASLGVAIAMSPYLGLHTYLAVLLSTVFRLPIYPIILGSYVNNPLTIAFIYTTAIKIGMKILNMHINVDISWSHITVKNLVKTGEELLIPFLIGTHIMALVAAIITFPTIYAVFYFYRNRKKS